MDPGIRDLALATGAAAHISKDQPPQEIMRVVRAAAGIAAPKATTGQPASAQAKLAERGSDRRYHLRLPRRQDRRRDRGAT